MLQSVYMGFKWKAAKACKPIDKSVSFQIKFITSTIYSTRMGGYLRVVRRNTSCTPTHHTNEHYFTYKRIRFHLISKA